MEETGVNESSTNLDIATDGDVVLVVGPGKIRFRVYSLILKVASKPFFSMLGPDWNEGRNLHNYGGPVEILLPEDDAAALEIILHILHHQNNKIPQNLTAEEILCLAITADKYELLECLKLAFGDWLLLAEEEKARDMLDLTTAAYLCQNAHAFREITRALVLGHSGSYLPLVSAAMISTMPWRVFYLLEEQRNLARLKVTGIVMDGMFDPIPSVPLYHKCHWSNEYAVSYSMEVKSKVMWPSTSHDLSILEALKLLKDMPDLEHETPKPDCGVSCVCYNAIRKKRENRMSSLTSLHDKVGLCLLCIRSGERYCTHGFSLLGSI